MQFYKFEGISTAERRPGENDSRRIMCEKARRISTKTNTFNLLRLSEAYLFVNDASGDIVTIGIIVKKCSNLNNLISEYLRAIGTELMETCLEEVTFSTLRNMLGYACRNDYIRDDDEVLEQFDLDKLERGYGRGVAYEEKILNDCNKKTVYEEAGRFLAKDTLIPELNRIYAGRGKQNVIGHPVHYMIETDDHETRKGICRVLLQALYAKKRLHSKRFDEAYSLVDDRNGSFGDEAISTIVQEMENHRDNVVVIFAGYPDKMECFLQKNPGLRSRIAYHVPFSDYDTESLCEIAKLIAKKKGLVITEEAYEKLSAMFDAARTENDFGNGRYVRNAIEKARMAQATRLLTMDLDSIESKDISTITADDIEFQEASTKSKTKQIGFCS